MLISNGYAELNRRLHESRADYGAIGGRWAPMATRICRDHGYHSVLDYGCGKGTFAKAMPEDITVHEYDPAIPGKTVRHTADLVVCCDVLEHVEPECIDDVLLDIRQLGDRALLVISTTPSNKRLEDGRNAHILVKPQEWWLDRVARYFGNVTGHPKRKLDELIVEVW